MKLFLRRASEKELSSTIMCLECGRRYASLTLHVPHVHGLSKESYVQKYNLPVGTRLASDRTRKRMQSHAILAEAYKNSDGHRLDTATIRPLAFIARAGKSPSPRMRAISKEIARRYLTPASKARSKRVRTKSCSKCGAEFFAPITTRDAGRRRKYCTECRKHYGIPTVSCELCGREFFVHGKMVRSRVRFCSNVCRYKAMKSGLVLNPGREGALKAACQAWHAMGTESVTCGQCGSLFSAHRHKKRKFCSSRCYQVHRKSSS